MADSATLLNGWWKLILGLLIGALAPSLIAWGAMSVRIEHNAAELDNRVRITTFNEYKEGTSKILTDMRDTLTRIETKLDARN